jgi:hypothetical protein
VWGESFLREHDAHEQRSQELPRCYMLHAVDGTVERGGLGAVGGSQGCLRPACVPTYLWQWGRWISQ